VTRRVRASLDEDATVRAADLLRMLDKGGSGLPSRHDAQWRWPLPAGPGRVVERLPAAEVRRLGAAAESTLRDAVSGGVRGRAVGERVLRDALLDHIPVVVITDDGARVEVPQRLVQAVVRMGFVGPAAGGAGRSGAAGGAGRSGAAGGADQALPAVPADQALPAGPGPFDEMAGEMVEVRLAGGWVGLAGAFGTAWHRPSTGLDVWPAR
jgi:hypothetical protein